MDAAQAVGDDRIQEKMQGQVSPESWTHGSAAMRHRWLAQGFNTGDQASATHLPGTPSTESLTRAGTEKESGRWELRSSWSRVHQRVLAGRPSLSWSVLVSTCSELCAEKWTRNGCADSFLTSLRL